MLMNCPEISHVLSYRLLYHEKQHAVYHRKITAMVGLTISTENNIPLIAKDQIPCTTENYRYVFYGITAPFGIT